MVTLGVERVHHLVVVSLIGGGPLLISNALQLTVDRTQMSGTAIYGANIASLGDLDPGRLRSG